jgi:hypothetical protein
MTYGNRPREGSGWQPFRLDYGKIAGQLERPECPPHCLRGWMDLPLRNHNAAVTGNPQDGESAHSRFHKPCKHCMA